MQFKNVFFVLLMLYIFVPIKLHAKIKSSSKPRMVTQSKTSITSSSSKVVNSCPVLNVGQLQIQASANAALEGLPVGFTNGGYSTNNGSQTSFTGSYAPATGTVNVSSSSCKSLPGTVNQAVTVSGNVSLEGLGNVANGLTLSDPTTNLTINSASAINSSINLNGGTSSLQSDLNFGSGNQFEGSGTIAGNGNSAILGGSDLTITSTLTWVNTDIVANSRLTLWGKWNLIGDIHVLGQGNILDLSHGGSLFIEHNSQVYIANLTIRGLGSRGTINFQDNTGQLVLNSCIIELVDDYTFNQGGVYIDGQSTVVTADNILSFDTNASMTVDGCSLWYDTLTFSDNSNIMPTPAQDPNQKFIAYLNNGLIRPVESSTTPTILAALVIQNSNAIVKLSRVPAILSGNVYNNITLDQTIILESSQDINITNTNGVIIDGNGQTLVFTNTSVPQFIVQTDVPVTLENITLLNINQNTFNIKSGGEILIGPNTAFEFSQTVTFSTGAFILTDTTGSTVFTLESFAGSQIVTFTASAILDLGNNTLQLLDTELDGITTIAYEPAALVELTSGSAVDIDVSTGLNFLAVGAGNALSLMNDNLTLSGLVAFGDAAVNELAIRFVLPDGVTTGNLYPTINIAGAPGIMLGGSLSNAQRLYFQDPHVILNLENSDSFLFDRNGQLFYNTLEVQTNNIKQYSANIVVNGASYIGQIIDPSFIRVFIPFQKVSSKPAEQISTKINAKNEKHKNKTADVKKRGEIQDLEETLGLEYADDLQQDLETLKTAELLLE